MHRPNHSRAEMKRLIDPARIAVVGASNRASSFGARVLENLRMFEGQVYPINPKYAELGGLRCYPDLASLPHAPDLIVVAAPGEALPGLVRDAVDVGAGSIVAFSAGFAETGDPELRALQHRMAKMAAEGGVRMVGPNALGFVNYRARINCTFVADFPMPEPRPEAIGLVSQSGAIGLSLVQSVDRGVSFSHVLTCGNSADVDVCDYIAYLAESEECRAIACVFEGISNPDNFRKAADLARRNGKPVVVCKVATSERGAEAALSHTGSLAGSAELYRALFDETGAVTVDAIEVLVPTAAFFAKASAPRPGGVCAISTSGGALIIASDAAERQGLPMPPPGPDVSAKLRERLPDFAKPANPLDVTGHAGSDVTLLPDCIELLLSDPCYSCLIIPITTQTEAAARRLLDAAVRSAQKADKMVCAVWISQRLEPAWIADFEKEDRIAVFHSMDQCCEAIAAWLLPRMEFIPAEFPEIDPAQRERVRQALTQADAETVSESIARELLAAYGITTIPGALVRNKAEAHEVAAGVGYPVALKADSSDIAHKSDIGAVILDIRTPAELDAACDRIADNVRSRAPEARINGLLVQRMARKGVEMIVGAKVDPLFGPVVTVGLGGIFVEVLQDAVSAFAPVDVAAAARMLDRLRVQKVLSGLRGAPPIDRARLADIVARVSLFIHDHQDLVSEIDINPVICTDDGATMVDALIVRQTAMSPTDARSEAHLAPASAQ